MKRIFFTVTNDLNYDQRMIRICTSLAKNNWDVTLIGRSKKTSQPIDNQIFKQKRLKLFFEKGPLFYLEFNLRLFFFLLKKADIICSVDLDTIVGGYFASKMTNKTLIFDAHEYFEEVPEVVNRPFIQGIWRFIGQVFIPKVRAAYTVCESLKNIFSKKYNIDFLVIRNVPFFKKSEKKITKETKKILLYQGALNDGRGLEEIIAALPHLDGFELWLAGEGDLSTQLREQSRRNGVETRVKFMGMIAPNELPNITAQADIGLNLLKNKGLNYYYSLANKTFDYIQAGIPAIHMDFPEYKIINDQYNIGALISDLDEKSIISAISEIKKSEKYEELSQNCRLAANELNWENEEQKLISFYNQFK